MPSPMFDSAVAPVELAVVAAEADSFTSHGGSFRVRRRRDGTVGGEEADEERVLARRRHAATD